MLKNSLTLNVNKIHSTKCEINRWGERNTAALWDSRISTYQLVYVGY